LMADEI